MTVFSPAPPPVNQTIPLSLGHAILVPAIIQTFTVFSLLKSVAAQQLKTYCEVVPPDGRDASEVSTHCYPEKSAEVNNTRLSNWTMWLPLANPLP